MDMGESDEKFPRQKVNENGLDTRYARPFHFVNGLRRHHKAVTTGHGYRNPIVTSLPTREHPKV